MLGRYEHPQIALSGVASHARGVARESSRTRTCGLVRLVRRGLVGRPPSICHKSHPRDTASAALSATRAPVQQTRRGETVTGRPPGCESGGGSSSTMDAQLHPALVTHGKAASTCKSHGRRDAGMPLGAPCAPLFLRAAADQPFPRRSAPKASGSDTVGEPAEPRSTRVPAARPGWVGWKQALPSSMDARARAIPATPAAATLITITIPEEPSSAISRAGTSDGANAGGRAADAAVAAPAVPAPRIFGVGSRIQRCSGRPVRQQRRRAVCNLTTNRMKQRILRQTPCTIPSLPLGCLFSFFLSFSVTPLSLKNPCVVAVYRPPIPPLGWLFSFFFPSRP